METRRQTQKITSHRDLRVWQEAMDVAMEVFQLSKTFPAEERFSLTDQVRRSSRSVATNVAEAWRKRRYEAAFVSKLNDAEGEAAETQTHLEIAVRCGYLAASAAAKLDERYDRLLDQLVTMSSHPEVWTVSKSPRPPVSVSAPRPVSASLRPPVPKSLRPAGPSAP